MPRALTSVLLPTGPWVRTQQRHQGSAASLADTMARRRQLRLRAARCVLRAAAQYAHGAGGVLNVHHDRNHGKEARLSTLMVYLRDHGGHKVIYTATLYISLAITNIDYTGRCTNDFTTHG